jgi:hypothetical protein
MKKFEYGAAALVLAVCVGCGGGGDGARNGGPDDLADDIGLIAELQTEAELCSLTIGGSTRADVEDVLGAPTNESESSLGVQLQYWYGSYQEFSLGQGVTILISFDTAGTLEEPLVMGMTFPQCWRDQLAATKGGA